MRNLHRVDSVGVTGGGWPTPVFYQVSFQHRPEYLNLHWHWFWSTAHRLHVIRPPGSVADRSFRIGPTVIDALAQLLVADLLSDTLEQAERSFDDRNASGDRSDSRSKVD